MKNNARISSIVALSIATFVGVNSCTTSSNTTPEIGLWHIQGVGNGPIIIEDAVNRFENDHPGVKVNVNLHLNDPYKLALRKALNAGTAPCIFPSWGGGVLEEYVQQGFLLNLTELVNTGGYRGRFMNRAFDNVTIDQSVWGVPVENTSAAVVFYNKDIFNGFGLKPPNTYDELLLIIDVLSDAGITPFALANKTKWPGSIHYILLVDRLGGSEKFINAAWRRGDGSFNDPVFIEAGHMLQDLVRRNAFNEGSSQANHDAGESRALLYSESAAMEVMGSWNIPLIKAENPQFFEDKLDFFIYPEIAANNGSSGSVIGTVGDHYYHISKTCSYQELAFEMIQYLIDDVALTKRSDNFGSIPPIKGFNPSETISQRVLEYIESASNLYLWYDQELPFDLGEIHKSTVQQLLDLSTSPEEAAQTMEKSTAEYHFEK